MKYFAYFYWISHLNLAIKPLFLTFSFIFYSSYYIPISGKSCFLSPSFYKLLVISKLIIILDGCISFYHRTKWFIIFSFISMPWLNSFELVCPLWIPIAQAESSDPRLQRIGLPLLPLSVLILYRRPFF